MAGHDDDKEHGKGHEDAHGGGGHAHAGGHGAHDGGHDEGEHEGAPEWLISFADNTALMMGFFVILLAMNMGPKGSNASEGSGEAGQPTDVQLDWVIALREAFNNPVNPHSTDPKDAVLVQRLRERSGDGDPDDPRGRHERTQSMQRGPRQDPSSVVYFAPSLSELDEQGRRDLDAIVDSVRGLRYVLEIRAHTSAAESSNVEAGFKLAFDRAMAVARRLIAQGIDRKLLRIVPVADNERVEERSYTAVSAARNRRAEIVVTDEVMP